MERIVAFQEETSPEIELSRLSAGTRSHAATMAYRLDEAVLADGSLYFKGGYEVFRPKSARPLLQRHADQFTVAQLCTNLWVERYFGHWVNDGLLLELLASRRSIPALRFRGKPWLHEPGYRKIVNLKAEHTAHARIEKLWVIDDSGTNADRILRLNELRRRVRSVATSDGPKRVMLLRGKLGASRNLVNGDEIHSALVRNGFEIIDPEAESVLSIVEKTAHAEMAVLVEGSAQNHCMLSMPEGSTLLTIQPATRFNAFSKTFSDALGFHWAFVVADAQSEGFHL
jgi:hypothetical protein